MKKLLNQRNIEILGSIARFHLLSTPQIMALHFPNAENHRSAYNVLNRLERNSLCSSTFTRTRTTRGIQAPRQRVWLILPQNQPKILRALEAENRHDEAEEIAAQFKTFNKNQTFAEQSLNHELGINSILMAAERSAETHPDIEALGWLRTSPRHPLTKKKITAELTSTKDPRKKIRRRFAFNPDAIFWTKMAAGPYRFFFLEFENDTSNHFDYRDKKLVSYLAYHQQGHFSELCTALNDLFDLRISKPGEGTFRLLTVSRTPGHMQDLFAAARNIRTEALFYFSHLDAVEEDLFSPIWFRKKEFGAVPYTETTAEGRPRKFPSHLHKYDELVDKAAAPVRRRWLQDTLGTRALAVALP